MASTNTTAAAGRRDQAGYIAALREERAGYERRGDKDLIKQVDAEIAKATKLLDPATASTTEKTTRAAANNSKADKGAATGDGKAPAGDAAGAGANGDGDEKAGA